VRDVGRDRAGHAGAAAQPVLPGRPGPGHRRRPGLQRSHGRSGGRGGAAVAGGSERPGAGDPRAGPGRARHAGRDAAGEGSRGPLRAASTAGRTAGGAGRGGPPGGRTCATSGRRLSMMDAERPDRGAEQDVLAPHFGMDERAEAFTAFLDRHRGEVHAVTLQDYPDPDAISSAMAYQILAATRDIEADLIYEGRVSHQENLALVHLLDIELTRFSEGMPLDRYDGAVYVDNQGTTTRLTERLEEAGVRALAVIDHHAPQGVLHPEFSDVRPVGAAATILTDYLRSGRILRLEPDRREHVHLATALIHGLRSETNAFIRAGPEEFVAAAYLSRYLDPQVLESVLRVQRSHGTMDVIRVALMDRTL